MAGFDTRPPPSIRDALRREVARLNVDPRRGVPRTDVVLADPRLVAAAARLGRPVVKAAVATALERRRRGEIPADEVAGTAARMLPGSAGGLRPVVNATGVLVHTNLGRAPLSATAVEAVAAAAGFTDVEFDLAAGGRAPRGRTVLAALLSVVPAAEAALAVNNNAAALMLAASALAAGREIVISRGELVEIGDGFRIPELLEATGARLREVGTTNRTTVADYAQAIGPETGMVLKVHPSNFVIRGFTSAASVRELAGLGTPLVVDIGSGLLQPDPVVPDEPDAQTALRDDADLVTGSGDKLLGGPQAGLILGKREYVERLRRHPVARALRVDKLRLAALEATVRGPRTPTYEALHSQVELLRARAAALVDELAGRGVDAVVVDSEATVGGGGAPGMVLPSAAVSLPAGYAEMLRWGDPPVVGRVERGRCLLDLRTVSPEQDATMRNAVLAAEV